jgi:hypothetical protein
MGALSRSGCPDLAQDRPLGRSREVVSFLGDTGRPAAAGITAVRDPKGSHDRPRNRRGHRLGRADFAARAGRRRI